MNSLPDRPKPIVEIAIEKKDIEHNLNSIKILGVFIIVGLTAMACLTVILLVLRLMALIG